MADVIDMTGEKHGRLTVIRRTARRWESGHTRATWECRCDCGNLVVVIGRNIRRGITTSCGCFRDEMKRRKKTLPGESGLKSLLAIYRIRATKSGIAFEIGHEEFKRLTSADCHYCGAKPAQLIFTRGGTHTTIAGRQHSLYRYNGIDRIQNAVGYVAGNCVPCCGRCNYAKGVLSAEQFIEMAHAISKHHAK